MAICPPRRCNPSPVTDWVNSDRLEEHREERAVENPSRIDFENDLKMFKATLESQSSYDQTWGRNHNVGFHVIWVLGVVIAVLAIVSDFSRIAGASMIGLAGGAILAAPAAFKMKEKSLWYFEYASQLRAIDLRISTGTLDHKSAVEEYIRLSTAMNEVWRELTRSIDITPIVEAAKDRATKKAITEDTPKKASSKDTATEFSSRKRAGAAGTRKKARSEDAAKEASSGDAGKEASSDDAPLDPSL